MDIITQPVPSLVEQPKENETMSDKQIDIDREYLFGERRSLLQRLGSIEDLLGIPRSVVSKQMRKPWKQFQEEHRNTTLDDYPEDDLDVAENGPN